MRITHFQSTERGLRVTWQDRKTTEFPFIWLRDNDPAELHPDSQERTFDLTAVQLDVIPEGLELKDGTLEVHWPDKGTLSKYTTTWLYRHRPGQKRQDPSRVPQELWNSATLEQIPRFDAQTCIESDQSLLQALTTLKRFGLIIIDNLTDDPLSGEAFGDRIGFKRETNFGVMFDVISKADPNNLAYTSDALPLHIDLTNQELVPGYQFLHAFRNEAQGGGSIFADGYRICADFESSEPERFDVLTRVRIPYRFHDRDCDIRRDQAIISRDANGNFEQFLFNAHLVDVPDMETDVLYEFYDAYLALMTRVRDPEYAITHILTSGEMVIFDNRRVMHGRTAFNPATGDRHLRGYYIDRTEVDSRIRVLARTG